MSALVYAGGAQFLAVGLVAAGGTALAIVLAGLLLNARHLPFGLAIGNETARRGPPARLVGSHIMTDESVAFALAQDDPARRRRAYWLTGVGLFITWNVSSTIGAIAGSALGDPDTFGIDAAFPAALLALTLPSLKDKMSAGSQSPGPRSPWSRRRSCPRGCPCCSRCWRRSRCRCLVRDHVPTPALLLFGRLLVSWIAIIVLAVGTYALRFAGPVLREPDHRFPGGQRYLTLAAVALLAALIGTAALLNGTEFVGFARPAGVPSAPSSPGGDCRSSSWWSPPHSPPPCSGSPESSNYSRGHARVRVLAAAAARPGHHRIPAASPATASSGRGGGRSSCTVEPEALTLLTDEAMHDIAHFLRPAHLAQLRSIIDDPQASPNDRFVALDLLRNANIAAGGVLPMCQDTGTAIVMGKRGRHVLTDGARRGRPSRAASSTPTPA